MSNYHSKALSESGIVNYTEEENETWKLLLTRQRDVVRSRACSEFLEGLEYLDFPYDRVPQCHEVTHKLQEATGWSVKAVPALISLKEFFHLVAHKQFPAATFIRKREELDYLKEPDIFHEFFGHCPLLTNQAYADFIEWYGKTALQASQKIQSLLGRLFWFTIEFGLLRSNSGLCIYGGGILSSFEETVYSLESPKPTRDPFDIHKVINTPYRYDLIQERYFVLEALSDLYEIQKLDIINIAKKSAKKPLEGQDFNLC
jgi:phenylalanine-4-hydroxylase